MLQMTLGPQYFGRWVTSWAWRWFGYVTGNVRVREYSTKVCRCNVIWHRSSMVVLVEFM
jgi:hypothetical protein